jgi:hypothetical protein
VAPQLRHNGAGDGSDGAEWLNGLWKAEHASVVSTFLMSVKATRLFAVLEDVPAREPGSMAAGSRLVLMLDVPKQYDKVRAASSASSRAKRCQRHARRQDGRTPAWSACFLGNRGAASGPRSAATLPRRKAKASLPLPSET